MLRSHIKTTVVNVINQLEYHKNAETMIHLLKNPILSNDPQKLRQKKEILLKLNNTRPINKQLELKNVDLSNLDLSNIELRNVNLAGANLSNTKLTGANFTDTNLYGATLKDTILDNTIITNTRIAPKDIHLFNLSANDAYLKLVESLEFKDHNICLSEEYATEKFIQSLNKEHEVQARLAKLSNQQLRILLPVLYVEASHPAHPTVAYNTKDGTDNKSVDDNVTMITGYADFLSTLNKLFDKSISHKIKVDELYIAINKLCKLLSGSYTTERIKNHGFYTSLDEIYSGYELKEKINVTKIFTERNREVGVLGTLPLVSLNCNIALELSHNPGNLIIKGMSFSPEKNITSEIEEVMIAFSEKLIDAYIDKDLCKIFQLTSDFQYLHLLPNANGRASQIIRDCFAIMLGKLPFSALSCMSHYIYLIEPVDSEHLSFMQHNSNEILCAIEDKELYSDFHQKKTPADKVKLSDFSKKNSAIEHDVNLFHFYQALNSHY